MEKKLEHEAALNPTPETSLRFRAGGPMQLLTTYLATVCITYFISRVTVGLKV